MSAYDASARHPARGAFVDEVFGASYADAYDMYYHDKDYTAECDLLERIFQTYGDGPIHNILDLGCGTGNHAIPLAQRGYKLVGVDRSESMLTHARRKATSLPEGNSVTFCQGDIRTVDLQQHFDAALIMFAVLSYQLENADVLSALRTARQHLRPGGLLIFDVWYGPAVLHQRPAQRVKVIPTPEGKLLRIVSGSNLDVRRHICTLHLHMWRLQGERLVAETEENHLLRFFFPRELDFFLECSGFETVRLGAFPEFSQDPDETTWNVLGVTWAV